MGGVLFGEEKNMRNNREVGCGAEGAGEGGLRGEIALDMLLARVLGGWWARLARWFALRRLLGCFARELRRSSTA